MVSLQIKHGLKVILTNEKVLGIALNLEGSGNLGNSLINW